MSRFSDRLEHQSLLLMAAAMVGHIGNYLFHLLTGRMLSEPEYGLMIALFGAVNLLLLPMSAFQVSLARAAASLPATETPGAVTCLLRIWFRRLTILGLAGLGIVWLASPLLRPFFGLTRLTPLLLAACIPVINLFLVLCGACLQGLQKFGTLSLRGISLYLLRALLVCAFLFAGFRAAGFGLLSHVLGMLVALGISLYGLRGYLVLSPAAVRPLPVLTGSLLAFPVLLSFSALMTADVILIRALHPEMLSGEFAQAATLGRMILWLPLPIAHVMFPKVVRAGGASHGQRTTLFKALGYTLGLVGLTVGAVWLLGDVAFELVFGVPITADQREWLRGISLCMALLGPVYVVIQFELARNRIRRLLPCCALALAYVGSCWFQRVTPDRLILLLGVASGLSLITAVRALAAEPGPPDGS